MTDSGELEQAATVSKMETVQLEGKRSVTRWIEVAPPAGAWIETRGSRSQF
jgi:hypothetical protein